MHGQVTPRCSSCHTKFYWSIRNREGLSLNSQTQMPLTYHQIQAPCHFHSIYPWPHRALDLLPENHRQPTIPVAASQGPYLSTVSASADRKRQPLWLRAWGPRTTTSPWGLGTGKPNNLGRETYLLIAPDGTTDYTNSAAEQWAWKHRANAAIHQDNPEDRKMQKMGESCNWSEGQAATTPTKGCRTKQWKGAHSWVTALPIPSPLMNSHCTGEHFVTHSSSGTIGLHQTSPESMWCHFHCGTCPLVPHWWNDH